MSYDLSCWAGPIATPDANELADRYAVSQLVKVYALGVDMRDYDLTRSVFPEVSRFQRQQRIGRKLGFLAYGH